MNLSHRKILLKPSKHAGTAGQLTAKLLIPKLGYENLGAMNQLRRSFRSSLSLLLLIALACLALTCGGGGSGQTPPSVSFTASPPTIAAGQTSTLTWSSQNATNLIIDDGIGSVPPSGSRQVSPTSTTTYTLEASGPGGNSQAAATVTVSSSSPATAQSGVFTYHNSVDRTGQNLSETTLTPANVNSSTFGKLFSYSVDGPIFTQPLYVANVNIPNQGAHNVIFVATEHDSLYAFDADGKGDGPLWHRSFIDPANGIVPMSTTDVGSDNTGIEVGVTGTPVIDPDSGTLYLVASTKENGVFFQRLHAIDITTGDDKFNGPIEISAAVKGTGSAPDGQGNVMFLAQHQNQRGALLLSNGTVYIIWGSHHIIEPWHGWLMAFDAKTLHQVAVFATTPNDDKGGIWQSGNGPAADENGNLFVAVGQGTFSANVGGSDYGNSMLKFSTSGGLNLIDYFTPHDQSHMKTYDLDLGVGGPVLLPDQSGSNHPHIALQVSKIGNIYLVDRDNLGHFHPNDDNQLVQFLPQAVGVFSGGDGAGNGAGYGTPSYWNGFVYFAGVHDSVKAFKLENGTLTGPLAHGPTIFDSRGGVTTVSANDTTDGVVWLISRINGQGVLYAYDAQDVSKEIYTSNQAGARDQFGIGVKFSVPTIFNGKVYVGGYDRLAVFGLLH